MATIDGAAASEALNGTDLAGSLYGLDGGGANDFSPSITTTTALTINDFWP